MSLLVRDGGASGGKVARPASGSLRAAHDGVAQVSEVGHPPLGVVQALHADLATRGRVALGGSALLYALGLVETVADWDLVTDVPPEQVAELLVDRGLTAEHLVRDSPMFATAALYRVDGGDHQIDVLVDFAIRAGGSVRPIPPRPWRTWQGMRLARPEDWELAYRLMGRAEKAALLRDWLRRHSPEEG